MTTERPRAVALQGLRAGFVSRVTAAIIDVLIVFVMLFGTLGAFAIVRYLLTDDPIDFPDPGAVWSSAALLVILVAVLTAFWSASGRSVGDSVVGLRVITETGNQLSWRRALARALVVIFIPVVSMLWILVSRKNAGIHDLICRTTVIYDWRAHAVSESRPHE